MQSIPIKLTKRFSQLALAITATCSLTLVAEANIRCATVNVDKVLKHYQKVLEQRESLIAKRDQYRERLATLVARRDQVRKSMTGLRAEIDKELDASSMQKAYYDRALKLHKQERSLNEHINTLEELHLKQAQKDLASLVRRSLDEIHVFIAQYAKEHQYQWIIDTSGHSSSKMSPLIYAKDAKDITAEVLAEINK
jgi:Skp family chaperone for outer membrane proteins